MCVTYVYYLCVLPVCITCVCYLHMLPVYVTCALLLQLLDDVNRCKESYECRLSKLVQNRIKYETMSRKGITPARQFYSLQFLDTAHKDFSFSG